MEYYLEYNNCNFYINKNGKGHLLLLIHGVASDSDYFAESSKILQKSFNVITYDRRGYSRSSIIDEEKNEVEDYSVISQADDAAFIIDSQKNGPAFIVASSAGGVVAVELLKRYSHLVSGMFLFEPPLIGNKNIKKIISEWKKEMMTLADEKRISKAFLSLKLAMGREEENKKRTDLDKWQKDLENFCVFLFKEIGSFLDYSFYNEYKKNSCNIFIAIGAIDENGLFSKAGKSAAEYLGAEIIKVKGYHNFPKDKPKEFAKILKQSLVK